MINKLALKYYKSKILKNLDLEMGKINDLVNKSNVAIDIGANVGFYSYHCSKFFNKVHAFEPILDVSSHLREYSKKNQNIILHDCALSNCNGKDFISIPYNEKSILNYGYASLSNKFKDLEKIEIEKRTLDSFNFNDVDFIKIDVEGHEAEVIEGGISSIKKFMPLMLVEIEKRHSEEAEATFEKLLKLGYTCFYIEDNKLKNFKNFCFNKNQNIKNLGNSNYICNFFFIPKD